MKTLWVFLAASLLVTGFLTADTFASSGQVLSDQTGLALNTNNQARVAADGNILLVGRFEDFDRDRFNKFDRFNRFDRFDDDDFDRFKKFDRFNRFDRDRFNKFNKFDRFNRFNRFNRFDRFNDFEFDD